MSDDQFIAASVPFVSCPLGRPPEENASWRWLNVLIALSGSADVTEGVRDCSTKLGPGFVLVVG